MRAVGLSLLAGLLMLGTGCSKEKKLAGHYEEMTEIMEDNMDDPVEGYKELREYQIKNAAEIAELEAGLMAELRGFEKKDEVKERSTEIFDNMKDVVKEYEKTRKKFRKKLRDEDDYKELREEERDLLKGKSFRRAMSVMNGRMPDDDDDDD